MYRLIQILPHFRLRRPELQELLEVPGTIDLLPGHGAVHHDLVPDDVLEDAIVGGRRAAYVVLRLQAVDRDEIERRGMSCHSAGISRTALVTSCT